MPYSTVIKIPLEKSVFTTDFETQTKSCQWYLLHMREFLCWRCWTLAPGEQEWRHFNLPLTLILGPFFSCIWWPLQPWCQEMTYIKKKQRWSVSVFPENVTPLCYHLVLAAFSFLKMQIITTLCSLVECWLCVDIVLIRDTMGNKTGLSLLSWNCSGKPIYTVGTKQDAQTNRF